MMMQMHLRLNQKYLKTIWEYRDPAEVKLKTYLNKKPLSLFVKHSLELLQLRKSIDLF